MTSAAETLGWTDLLSNHNIKPWWETLRSLILVAMTLNTTFMLIYAKDIGVSCVPVANVTYGAAQSKYIETIFGWELLMMVCIPVWLSVLSTGLMFVASNYWLYWPSVGDAIIRFSKALDLHNDLHAALTSLESAVTTSNKQKPAKREGIVETSCGSSAPCFEVSWPRTKVEILPQMKQQMEVFQSKRPVHIHKNLSDSKPTTYGARNIQRGKPWRVNWWIYWEWEFTSAYG